MSDYPQAYGAGYGGSFGSHDQQYGQPSYQTRYAQNDEVPAGYFPASNYDTSMSAYHYNTAMPAFSTPSVPPTAPLPIFQGWNQDPVPLPPYTAPQNAQQYPGYLGNEHYNPHYGPPIVQQPYQYNAEHHAPYDEGELSEGEFDDRGGAPQLNASSSTPYAASQGNGIYANPTHHSAYPGPPQFTGQQLHHEKDSGYTHAPPQTRRDKSHSHSPYTPANEATRQSHPKEIQKHNPHASSNLQAHSTGTPQKDVHGAMEEEGKTTKSISRRNGLTPPNGSVVSQSPVTAALPPTQAASAARSRLAEARKRAQGAILNLWPLEVRFQNYIDEGFDERLVSKLFDELGMPQAPSQNATEHRHTPKSKKVLSEVPGPLHDLKSSPTNGGEEAGSRSSLVGDAQNNHKNDTVLSSTTNSAIGMTVNIPPKRVGTTEKEQALRLKMEALRKSREERAQKAAAKNKLKPEALPIATQVPEREAPKVADATAPSTSFSISNPILSPQPPQTNQAHTTPATVSATGNQQAPVIPGLFLTSSTSSPASSNHIVNPVSQRKRPVAADFDTPSMAPTSFKRPFGHSRNDQPLVIDVSDEEGSSDAEDVEMDLESQGEHDSPTHASRKISDARRTTIQNLPLLSNFPSHKPFTPPHAPSATTTPTISQSVSKGTFGRPEDLLKKETEIELLKKKIAEAEARRKARQTPSGFRTPHVNEALGEGKGANSEDIAKKVEASIKMQNLIGIAENEAKSAQRKLADVQVAELQKAEELRKNEAEQKRLRREKLAADLPRVDAEVVENQSKLDQLRLQLLKVEAAVQKSLEDKRSLAEEMERLGQETELQLQAQKDKLNDLTKDEATTSNGNKPVISSSTLTATPEYVLPVEPSSNPQSSQAQQPVPGSPQARSNEQSSIPSKDGQLPSKLDDNHADSDVENAVGSDEAKDVNSADHILEAALQDAVRADAEAQALDNEDLDMEDSYAPNPNQLAPDPSVSPVEESRSCAQSSCPDVDMSDGIDDESDDYEPPEASPPAEHYSPPYSPPFSPAPIEIGTNLLTDTRSSAPPMQNVRQLEVKSRDTEGTSLQPNQESVSTEIQLYTPYESPLYHFRAYRFHPEYQHKVAGGLRSISYSNKIDPNIEFCRYELAGGVCNDPECEFQHFKDIRLPDDAVLTALGSPDEFYGEQRDKFCAGLKAVLNDLRERRIRDFEVIASEIVAHRSKFLGDPSKVLMLEGTTI